MADIPTATILHLSDLHLGEDFDDVGDEERFSGPSLGAAAEAFRRGGLPAMQTHDARVCAALRAELKIAGRRTGVPGELFDFYAITGDISTNANSDARFAFARQFLLGEVAAGPTFSPGLGLAGRKVFCVPGNHDKMFEAQPARYLSAFDDLPAPPPYATDEVVARSGQRFTFYGIDSNLYREGNIAVGEITDGTHRWLKERLDPLPSLRADGVVRVLLLHHHPADLNPFRRWLSFERLQSWAGKRFTLLQESARLIETCRGKIDIIMHGHEHFPVAFLDPVSDCFVVSAGTATESQINSGHSNSFHALTFYGKTFNVFQFDWGLGGFTLTRQWAGSLAYPRADLKPVITKNVRRR